jgi:2-oxo-4-hydroxy-4-carboxy-5-ureidoimidazoline decarboxylase
MHIKDHMLHISMVLAGKEEVLRRHPDLAGCLADEGKLTRDSAREQQSAGLHNLTPKEKAQMNHLNAR